ncbi:MAG: S-layer homology domain-containing protein [Bacillota bacterium]
MKKIFSSFFILLFIITVFTVSVSAAEIEDISEDHWAYDSVQKLIDRGYFNLYEDDTFKGENKVSRYELATILARMLDDLQTSDVEITEDDTDELRKLSLEFRDELVEIAKKQEDIFNNLESNKEKNVVQTESIGENRELISSNKEEINNIIETINELKTLSNEVEKLNENLKEQSITIQNLEEKLQENDQDISTINEELKNIGKDLGSQEAIQDIKDQQSVTVTNVNSLNSKVNSLNKKLEEQNTKIEELKQQNQQHRIYFIALAAAMLIF